jgi:hypothetical protein
MRSTPETAMSILRSLAALLVAAAATLAVGCAPPGEDVGETESDVAEGDEALDVAFVAIDARRSAADAGLTVIKSKGAYRDFFGSEPPADVQFNKHWVLHYSMGIMNTGGYGTEITSIEKVGSGQDRRLVVHTVDTSPGFGCFVTQALTNPQVAVRINKHNGADVEAAAEVSITDCSQENFCHRVRCANGYECDEAQDACVPRACDPEVENDCGPLMQCVNRIVCITTPCPADYRCEDPCAGLTYDGTCEGQTVRWCENLEIFEVTCEEPTTCGLDEAGFADCR